MVLVIGHMSLKSDGPTVVEAPPKMLGFAMDALKRYLIDIGPLGPDKGNGGKYPFSRRDTPVRCRRVTSSPSRQPTGRFRSSRFQGRRQNRPGSGAHEADQGLSFGRGVQPAGNGVPQRSGKAIDTIHADTIEFFAMLSRLVDEELANVFTPTQRFQMMAIGIEKGKPSIPIRRRGLCSLRLPEPGRR